MLLMTRSIYDSGNAATRSPRFVESRPAIRWSDAGPAASHSGRFRCRYRVGAFRGMPRRRIKGRGRQRFFRNRGERVSVSVAAQKPEIDNGESDCRLPVEAFGGGQEAIGGSAPQSRWTTGEIA